MATQPIRSAPGQQYGQRAAQEAAQRAVPLPQVAMPAPVPLSAPTQRPGEPVTAGVAAGPGPGPNEIGIPPAVPDRTALVEQLRALAQMYPTPELFDLLEDFA